MQRHGAVKGSAHLEHHIQVVIDLHHLLSADFEVDSRWKVNLVQKPPGPRSECILRKFWILLLDVCHEEGVACTIQDSEVHKVASGEALAELIDTAQVDRIDSDDVQNEGLGGANRATPGPQLEVFHAQTPEKEF